MLKKLAQGFKSSGTSANQTRTVHVESRAKTHYITGLRLCVKQIQNELRIQLLCGLTKFF